MLLQSVLLSFALRPRPIRFRITRTRNLASVSMTTTTRSLLDPPQSVREMKTLDRSLFNKVVDVPCVLVDGHRINQILKPIKPFLLKLNQFKSVYEDETTPVKRWILLSPDRVKTIRDLDPLTQKVLQENGIGALEWKRVELKYENWKSEEILNAVLPNDCNKSTSYSRIGHIVHLNLREHLTDYRFLIGQVLLDKLAGVSCAVNKTDTIDTTYRNFAMEVLAGDGNMSASVRENGCQFEFDFSEVFWNPRLSSEHERIVDRLPSSGDVVLYDVFAGVGPFAIPAARFKKCRVLANDLNPSSFRYLERNVKLNRVENRVTAYNMDGRRFIREIVSDDIVKCWTDPDRVVPSLHVVMNLPALAVEFLDAFRGLTSSLRGEKTVECPTVHCYTFCKGGEGTLRETVISAVESVLGDALDPLLTEVSHVRKVAPNKDMARISFVVPSAVLFAASVEDGQEPPTKRKCCHDSNLI